MKLIAPPTMDYQNIYIYPSKFNTWWRRLLRLPPKTPISFQGRADIGTVVIEFDGVPRLGVKIDKIEFEDYIFVGVVPFHLITSTHCECYIDWFEHKEKRDA